MDKYKQFKDLINGKHNFSNEKLSFIGTDINMKAKNHCYYITIETYLSVLPIMNSNNKNNNYTNNNNNNDNNKNNN
jgi:hypothetical protein